MGTQVPAVDRAAQILQLLAQDPGRGQTASQIAAALGIHPATCHATVVRLDALGLLRRDSVTKTYLLGPALVGLGFAATSRFPAFVTARTQMFRVAAELGLSCLISVRDGSEIVVLDIAGDTAPAHLPVRIGRRVPSTAALGSVFYAWAPEAEIERWIHESDGQFDLSAQQRRQVLAVVRSRGYSLGGEQDFGLQLDAMLRRLADDADGGRTTQIALELADLIRSRLAPAADVPAGDVTAVNFVIAPIFDPRGRVQMAYTLFGKPGQLTTATVPRYAEALLAAADRVTAATGGHRPGAPVESVDR